MRMLRDAQTRDNRAVFLVPELLYSRALKSLGALYTGNPGRTALMPNGQLVSVITPKTSLDLTNVNFDLYLMGWGVASLPEEQALIVWAGKASSIYTEISQSVVGCTV